MGMYTEIFTRLTLKRDVEPAVVAGLHYLAGERSDGPDLPTDPLFSMRRAGILLSCSSFYHQPRATKNIWQEGVDSQWYVCTRSDLKNYEGEIQAFFKWIAPYVDACGDVTFIGYSLYEEDERPTLYYVTEAGELIIEGPKP